MENKKYLCAITKIYYDDDDQKIYDWYENAKKQSFFNWTEHVIRYEDWKRPFDSMKKRKNFRFLRMGDPYWKDPDTLCVVDWKLEDKRNSDFNEKIIENLWRK